MQTILDYIADPVNRVHTFVAVQGTHSLLPENPQQTQRFPVYSLTKSVLSLGIGLLANAGRFDIHRSLVSYLTAAQRALIPEEHRAALERLPVERFLTMSLPGYAFRPEGEADWIVQALTARIDYTQPPAFAYSNFPALLVGIAAQNAADEPFKSFLDRELLAPLGIEDAPCRLTPEGYFYGATGMELSAQELLRLGSYLLQNASSDPYLREAVRPQIATEKGGYGYFFWVGDGYYFLSGKWGQKCIVFPENGAVLAYLSDRQEGDSELFDLAVRFGRNLI